VKWCLAHSIVNGVKYGGVGPRLRFCCEHVIHRRTAHTGKTKSATWQAPWTLALETPPETALAEPPSPAEPLEARGGRAAHEEGVVKASPLADERRHCQRHPFLESFEGPPLFDLHGLGVGDTAFVVDVHGSFESWAFWYSDGDDGGLAAACGLFNLLCREFCRIHQIRKSVDDPRKTPHNCDDSWSVTMRRVVFGGSGAGRPDAHRQGHDPQRPYLRRHKPAVFDDTALYVNAFGRDVRREAAKKKAAKKKAADEGHRVLCAEWHMNNDSGRTTGLKQREASVVGYHSCVPLVLRAKLPNVRGDDIDDDKRHATFS